MDVLEKSTTADAEAVEKEDVNKNPEDNFEKFSYKNSYKNYVMN